MEISWGQKLTFSFSICNAVHGLEHVKLSKGFLGEVERVPVSVLKDVNGVHLISSFVIARSNRVGQLPFNGNNERAIESCLLKVAADCVACLPTLLFGSFKGVGRSTSVDYNAIKTTDIYQIQN